VNGELADWTIDTYLLARLVDVTAMGNWQRGGGKGSKPKPVPRPKKKSRVGTTVMSLDDMDKHLGYSPRQQALAPQAQRAIER
jgi:hypothetical protein